MKKKLLKEEKDVKGTFNEMYVYPFSIDFHIEEGLQKLYFLF